MLKIRIFTFVVLILFFVGTVGVMPGRAMPGQAAANLPVYSDSLASGWQDWSYGGQTSNYANTNPLHGGANSIAVTYTGGWSGLQIGYHGTNLDVSSYDTFRFWIHGGSTGGQNILLQIGSLEQTINPQANTWTMVDVSLLSLGSPRTVYSITWFNNTAGSQAKFYLDDIAFVGSGSTPPPPPPPGVGPALSVNAMSGQHPISPYIYGMNYANETIATDLDLPVRRWGGNSTSRYNWQNGFTNTGSDWYYENIPGNNADNFVAQDRRTGTKTILTMPLIGWVSKNSPSDHPYACGFKISKYGSQEDADWNWDVDCGNGNHTNGTPITGNDPLDTSVATTPSFATGWVNHITSAFGTAANGGVQFYNLDNEPMLWNSTHRDVHPNATTYDEMRTKTWAYAAAIKSADPTAQTLGPVVWGWCAYFYSAADGCSPGPDRAAHGNVDFVEWYLQQMRAYEQQHGVRILDYVDVHIYPQIDGVYSDSLGSADVQAARLRSTRQLWDPTYVHEGWIGQPVYLIPRMKQWVANDYPGTKLAITEYNWGALGYMNGALAQADLLGIFGREGLDLATLWGPPDDPNAPAVFAFRMYRNYDGVGSKFGDISLAANSADQSQLAIYAALRAQDGALTLMVINKTSQALTSSLALENFQPATTAQVYSYSPANLSAIVHESDQSVTPSGFSAEFPANSITLFVIPSATTTNLAGCPLFPNNNIWNTHIDTLPVNARSDQWVNTIGRTTGFHMDFGSGTWDGGPIGIPYNVVDNSVTGVPVSFYYNDQSDIGLYPIPANPLIEYGSDHHILIVNSSNCHLYEIYDASYSGSHWYGGSGAIWDINSNALRQDTWTSADAAGLPILPGLVRYDEILSGHINHAIRFTAAQTNGYIWPARHLTSNDPSAPQIPPMGARFRLKSTYNITSFPSEMQVILQAMKEYGIILADNGSNWYVSGVPDQRWNNDQLHLLDVLKGNDFEAVDSSELMIDPDSGATSLAVVTISGSTGIGNTTLNYIDRVPQTVISANDGSYTLSVPSGWSGTVTPSKSCYTFNLTSKSYTNVTSNLTNQNYSYSIDPTCSEVTVSIGGALQGTYGLPASGRETPYYPDIFTGPVKVLGNSNIFASERTLYGSSFNEVLGIRDQDLTTEYWFPWYDFSALQTWVTVANPNPNGSPNATVEVYLANTLRGSVSIPPSGRETFYFPQYPSTGPVHVISTNSVKVMASERSLYQSSMNETPGITINSTTPPTEYWFPWYDTTYMQTSILVGNPNPSGDPASVQISVGDTTYAPEPVSPGAVIIKTYPNKFTGPVKVKSLNGISIYTTERSYYGSSYTETPGMLRTQFTTRYWFPWYDTTYMQTWISIGNPTTQTAYVDINIHGVKQNTTQIEVPAGGFYNAYYPSVFDGPVEVVSTGTDIFVTERTLYNASFEEVTGIPHNQLTTTYWFPWYDFRYMSTWVSIGKP